MFIKQVDSLELPPSLNLLLQKIFDLLEIAESLLSRSSKGVFPFHLKHVELYRQLFGLSESVNSNLNLLNALSGHVSVDLQFIVECLKNLSNLIKKIVDNALISELIGILEDRFAVFQEIRRVLAQADKTGEEIKEEITSLVASLQSDASLAEVYKIVEKRCRMYENELYTCYDNTYVPRTNNDLEDFNHRLKRPIRKGQGRTQSWFYVEHQGESATYYHNLLYAPHVVGGAEISWSSEQTPLERIGVLETVTVSNIMNMIGREYLYKSLEKNDKLYTVHRWTRRIFKHGLEKCLEAHDEELTVLAKIIVSEDKSIIGCDSSTR